VQLPGESKQELIDYICVNYNDSEVGPKRRCYGISYAIFWKLTLESEVRSVPLQSRQPLRGILNLGEAGVGAFPEVENFARYMILAN
jgi:hypothetical protein